MIASLLLAGLLALSAPIPTQFAYLSERECMTAAAVYSVYLSTYAEVGGVLYRQGLAYHYTRGVVGEPGAVDYRVSVPRGAVLVALYHTHPSTIAGAIPNQFSHSDIALANRLGLPMYVLVVGTGEVIAYHAKGV